MVAGMPAADDNSFGSRLRDLRERTKPEEVGLSSGGRRRVAGLRREELAAFSDLSVDYLTRLEQGHARKPSADVVKALGRALRLTQFELEHLYHLAGHAAPSDLDVPCHLSPGVQRTMDRLVGVPIAAYDATWTLITCNVPWRRLHGAAWAVPGFNLVQATFADQQEDRPEDALYAERFRQALVADLRIAAARYPADGRMQHLLRTLFTNSIVFASMWARARASPFATEEKLIRHPTLGDFWLDCDVLTASDGDTRLVLYTSASGSAGERALTQIVSDAEGDEPRSLPAQWFESGEGR